MSKPSSRLLDVAQAVMDIYFQDFAPDDSFFRIEDFAVWIGYYFGKDVDDIAQTIYKNSLAENGIGAITFSSEWLQTKEFEVKKDGSELFINIDIKPASFTYDNQDSGIQNLVPVGGKGNCGTYVRTTLTEVWQLKFTPISSVVFWYVDGTTIRFVNNNGCAPKKVRVYYVPNADDEKFSLPKSREFIIASQAYNTLITAKKGMPYVDKTNDSNPNTTQQTETDLKQMQPVT